MNPGTQVQISSSGGPTLPRETCIDVNADVFSITHGGRGRGMEGWVDGVQSSQEI